MKDSNSIINDVSACFDNNVLRIKSESFGRLRTKSGKKPFVISTQMNSTPSVELTITIGDTIEHPAK